MITLMLRSTDLTSRSKRWALLLTAAFIPLESGCLPARKEGIDQDLGLSKLNFPPRSAEPF
jgi:hypothetical protein